MDTQDQLALIKRMYKAHNIDDDRFPARQLSTFIADAKEKGLRPNAVEAGDEFTRRQVEHYALYDAMCQREGVVDFAELLLRSYELLARHGQPARPLPAPFLAPAGRRVPGHERAAVQMAALLAGPDTAVFAVGDDDQSIYAFRGANVANMQHFERDFATAERPVRADQARAELPVARHDPRCRERADPAQPVAARQGPVDERRQGEPVRVFAAPSDLDEAAFIVDVVKGLADEGVPLSEVGAPLSQERAVARARACAVQRRDPYRVYGGMRFFERAEVKHALAYLRLVAAPGDDGALLRVINFPPRGVGARIARATAGPRARRAARRCGRRPASGAVGGKSGAAIAPFVR